MDYALSTALTNLVQAVTAVVKGNVDIHISQGRDYPKVISFKSNR